MHTPRLSGLGWMFVPTLPALPCSSQLLSIDQSINYLPFVLFLPSIHCLPVIAVFCALLQLALRTLG